MIKRVAFACLLSASAAQADDVALMDFIAGQGCALGPATYRAAIDAGFEVDDYNALFDLADPTGSVLWRILPADICTIRLPDVTSEIKLNDPEVLGLWSGNVSDPEFKEYGCYATQYSLFEEVQKTRGWSADKANLEHVRFLAQHIMSGDIRYYSDNALVTPPSYQLMRGTCGDIPTAGAILESHTILVTYFDAFVRDVAQEIPCVNDARFPFASPARFTTLSDGRSKNVNLDFEANIIAMGAGWYEGLSMTNRGTPRPPWCTYE